MTGDPRLPRILFFLSMLPLAGSLLLASCHGPAAPSSGASGAGGSQAVSRPAPGIQVTLNPGSTIRTDTGNRIRTLSVDGDGLFRLSGDSAVILRTGMLNLKGSTATFRLQAHRQSPGQSVEILRGTLEAEKAYPSAFPDTEILHAGSMVMINRDIDLMEKETFDTTSLSQRLKGALQFRDITAAALVKRLEDWYGVEIEADGESTRRFSGTFENADIRTVLDALSRKGGFSYRLDGYTVKLDFR